MIASTTTYIPISDIIIHGISRACQLARRVKVNSIIDLYYLYRIVEFGCHGDQTKQNVKIFCCIFIHCIFCIIMMCPT
jgi:hypothetical protein